jgi:hypothetical protein
MKRSKLIQIIKEEVNREIIIEGIIDKLLWLFLSPKVKKDVDLLKGSAEWKELVHKLNTTRDEMEMYNNQAEEYLKRCKERVAAAKKQGFKVSNCNDLESGLMSDRKRRK